MSDNKSFDLIVIGGGTGGNGDARMAANAGWTVASIDSLPFGGTCALRGCDPKKMLIAVSEGIEWVRSLDGKGLEAQTAVNWPDMIAFKRTFTDAMPGRIEGGLEKAGVTVLHGKARFTGRDKIEVNGENMSARHFHIATGARPMTLNIPGEELLATVSGASPGRSRRSQIAGAGRRRSSIAFRISCGQESRTGCPVALIPQDSLELVAMGVR